jgi:L-aspartate oxidase
MQTDVLIIGSGLSGATAALRLAQDHQRQVTLITRAKDPVESNSKYAQGGIVGEGIDDSPELIAGDVTNAGAGLCFAPAVNVLAEEGPQLVTEFLIDQCGVPFDQDQDGTFSLGLEGAHSRSRILHAGDRTGQAIMESLMAKVVKQPNINLLTGYTAVDLITFPHHARDPIAVYQPPTCHGAYIFNQKDGKVEPILAGQTILATGGLGQIFLNTTNPPGSRGDGLAMAYRAGARVINSEYVQFHPTALSMPGTTKFLISEAVRGDGGVLFTPKGEPFMACYAPEWKDLAPRDVVARAIYWEMLANDYHHVLLDIHSYKPADYLKGRFPKIYKTCLDMGLDITQQPIPVVPAAHYFCGGVMVDLWGRSTLDGLYAVGEVSCTGVHGANRLASTSLLEAVVWGDRTARAIKQEGACQPLSENSVPGWDDSGLVYEADPALIQGDMQSIRNLMWHYVGLLRSAYRLNRAKRELRHLWFEIEDFYRKTRLTDTLIGLRNSAQVALIVAQAASHNRSCRGSHYREDFSEPEDAAFPPLDDRLMIKDSDLGNASPR